jgi:hypothetical protein
MDVDGPRAGAWDEGAVDWGLEHADTQAIVPARTERSTGYFALSIVTDLRKNSGRSYPDPADLSVLKNG